MSKNCLIFDFDWSLINENSDTYVFRELNIDIYNKISHLRDEYAIWTHLMDFLLGELHNNNIRKNEIVTCLQNIPFFNEMKDIVHIFHEKKDDIYIISDANTEYIQIICEKYFPNIKFTNIFTNEGTWDNDDRLRLRTYQDAIYGEPHNCMQCPEQMCKGDIIKKNILFDQYESIIYVGDGSGDYCAVQKLREKNDLILAREDFSLSKMCRNKPNDIKANILTWNNGKEALSHVKTWLNMN